MNAHRLKLWTEIFVAFAVTMLAVGVVSADARLLWLDRTSGHWFWAILIALFATVVCGFGFRYTGARWVELKQNAAGSYGNRPSVGSILVSGLKGWSIGVYAAGSLGGKFFDLLKYAVAGGSMAAFLYLVWYLPGFSARPVLGANIVNGIIFVFWGVFICALLVELFQGGAIIADALREWRRTRPKANPVVSPLRASGPQSPNGQYGE